MNFANYIIYELVDRFGTPLEKTQVNWSALDISISGTNYGTTYRRPGGYFLSSSMRERESFFFLLLYSLFHFKMLKQKECFQK